MSEPERIVCEACHGAGCWFCYDGYVYFEAAPQPPASGGLVGKWRKSGFVHMMMCADELEAALKQVEAEAKKLHGREDYTNGEHWAYEQGVEDVLAAIRKVLGC